MSYEDYEFDLSAQSDALSELDETGKDHYDSYGEVNEGYESIIERYENPAAHIFGREGAELPDGVSATEYQQEGDGLQSRLIDMDGDGIYETLEVTSEKDGQINGVLYLEDFDADGVADREEEFIIVNDGAGRSEVSARAVRADVDGDGAIDVVQVQEKTGDAMSFDQSEFREYGSYVVDAETGEWREVRSGSEEEKELIDAALHPVSVELTDYDPNQADRALNEISEKLDEAARAAEKADDVPKQTVDNGASEKYFDSNGDGTADYGVFRATEDRDGDGVKENYYWEVLDSNGDGNADTKMVAADLNGDGRYDVLQAFEYNSATGEMELVGERDVTDSDRRDLYFELKTFDPESSSDVTGNPEKAMELWEYQGSTQRCAVYAQMFVIEEMTGVDLDIDDLAEFASDRGWFNEATGTMPADMNKILDAYGIENELKTGCDISEVESALKDGKRVIVAVDSDEYAWGENDDVYVPGDRANHAVEVIGIDRSDPEHPMVILNDSGHVNGQGAMIPLDEFEDAWEDSSNLAVICG